MHVIFEFGINIFTMNEKAPQDKNFILPVIRE